MSDAQDTGSNAVGDARPLRLRDALRKARIEAADRTGVVVDLRDAEVARLEILNEALDPLFGQIPERIDLFGNLREQMIERLVENLEPGDFGVAQIDHDTGAIGRLDAGLPQGVAQSKGLFSRPVARGILHVGHRGRLRFEGFKPRLAYQ